MNKCTIIFITGMITATAGYSFFNFPQQMFNTGSGMMFPPVDKTKPQQQTLICDCRCDN